MTCTLPMEPYITNILNYYNISPSFEPLKFYQYVLENYGARVIDSNMFSVGEWAFDTEEQRTIFLLKFGS